MTITPSVTIRYSCHACRLKDVDLAVPARDAEQDVVSWVEGLGPQIGADHARRSPLCVSEVCDLMIPVHGRDRVGDAIRQ